MDRDLSNDGFRLRCPPALYSINYLTALGGAPVGKELLDEALELLGLAAQLSRRRRHVLRRAAGLDRRLAGADDVGGDLADAARRLLDVAAISWVAAFCSYTAEATCAAISLTLKRKSGFWTLSICAIDQPMGYCLNCAKPSSSHTQVKS
jgi:hypothetical protein